MTHLVICEGADDRAIIEALVKGGALPGDVTLRRSVGVEGVDGVAEQLGTTIDARVQSVAIRDLDDFASGRAATTDLLERVARAKTGVTASIIRDVHQERLFLCEGAGVNGRTLFTVLVVGSRRTDDGLTTWSMDDLTLVLQCDPQAFAAFVDREPVNHDHERVMNKLREVRELFVSNGMPLDSSKRRLQIVRAIIGYRASPATANADLVRRSLEVLGRERVCSLLSPLVEDLTRALETPDAPASDD